MIPIKKHPKKENMNNKVVLAYSGGLDTSYCVKYLTEERGLDVYAISVNTGGFDEKELEHIRNRALKLGVKDYVVRDVVKEYYDDCLKYLLFGNILKISLNVNLRELSMVDKTFHSSNTGELFHK